MPQVRNNDIYHFPTERRKGVVATIIFHAIIVVLLLFTGFSKPDPPPEEEGILVNFGYDETGSGLLEPTASSSAEAVSVPDEGETDPIAEEIIEEVSANVQEVAKVEEETLTQDFEEAPVVKKKVEQPDPVEEARKKAEAEAEKLRLQKLEEERQKLEEERVRKAQEEAERIRKAEEEARLKREAEALEQRRNDIINRTRNALNSGEGTGTSTSTSEGIEGGTGNQGVKTGSVDSNVYGDGSGMGTEGVSFDLQGRKASSLTVPSYDSQEEGKVVVEVTVDRNGKVIDARAGVKGSTTLEAYFLRVAREAAMTTKFDRKPDAPVIQKGTITYHFILR